MDRIEVFAELGRRLETFGRDAATCRVIERACALNAWFSPSDICRAVDALRLRMLHADTLRQWLTRYPLLPVAAPGRVLVVMAGNIPLVGFSDLLCVLLSGHACTVKPSEKDRVMIEYVVGQLQEICPSLPLDLWDETEVDAVIASGSDRAACYFRSRFAGVPALLRGSRYSAAVLSGRESADQLRGLSDDIFAYSGLGCRSVSFVFMPRGYELVLEVPVLSNKYINNYRQRKAVMTMTGLPYRDLGGLLMTQGTEFPAAIGEIRCMEYDALSEVSEWLAACDERVQCVVTDCLDHPRRAGFGQAQYPSPTDYPDGRDVMDFLSHLI